MKTPLPPALRRPLARLNERVRRATPRERTLLAGVALMGTLLLLSGGTRWLRAELTRKAELAVRVAQNESLQAQAPLIEAAVEAKRAKLSGKRVSGTEFLATIDTHARECMLNADTATPRTDTVKGITLHHARMTIRGAPIARVMEFDDRIRLRATGLAIERVVLDARSPGELTAAYDIAACQPE